MYHQYFENKKVKPEFQKGYISLWSGWLGEENYYKLDKVTKNEWKRFNDFFRIIVKDYEIQNVDSNLEKLITVTNIDDVLLTYEETIVKDYSLFSKFVIPKLNCIITEEWDYTYIIWYNDNDSIDKLIPYIKLAKLFYFTD